MPVHLRLLLASLMITAATGSALKAQDIQRGKLKSLDIEKRTLVVTVDKEDRELRLTDQTRVLDSQGTTLTERLKGFEPGVEIFFRAEERDGHQTAVGLRLVGNNPAGQPEQRPAGGRTATVKKIEGKTVTLTVEGKDVELSVTDGTELRGVAGATQDERLQAFKPGSEVMFQSQERDGKATLRGMMPRGNNSPSAPGARTSPDHSQFRPLTELGKDKYQEFEGGLYPKGSNQRPAAHEAAGLKLAARVQPLNAEGQPSPNGKIVLLSLGMSNTNQISQGLELLLRNAQDVAPQVVFVNGSQGGMVAEVIQNPNDGNRGSEFWRTVDQRLQAAGVTRQQVQAIWMKHADAAPRQGFPGYPRKLQAEMLKIVQILPERFPNARLCYLSSRTYGGYATSPLNPEPVAYESGFAVKWLIEAQLNGDAELNFDPAKGPVRAPWLSWGPYLWANGATKRQDGLSYAPEDFAADGTHHAPAGMQKAGGQLLNFLRTDTTTKSWFVKSK